MAPAEGMAASAQLRLARAAMPAGAILAAGAAAAGPDTKAAATIAAAGCSDGNLGPDFSKKNISGRVSPRNGWALGPGGPYEVWGPVGALGGPEGPWGALRGPWGP